MLLQVCTAAGGEDAYQSVCRLLRSNLQLIPKVSPPTDQPRPSPTLIKILQAASKDKKARGDTYLGVDLVLQHLLNAVCSGCLQ